MELFGMFSLRHFSSAEIISNSTFLVKCAYKFTSATSYTRLVIVAQGIEGNGMHVILENFRHFCDLLEIFQTGIENTTYKIA